MPLAKVYDIHYYRRRRAFRLNKKPDELDTPDIRLNARMEMIRERIGELVRDPVRCKRVSAGGVELSMKVLEARKHTPDELKCFINYSDENKWLAKPNWYLAVIYMICDITPPPTKP